MGFAHGIGFFLISLPLTLLLFSGSEYCLFNSLCATSILTGIGFLIPGKASTTHVVYVKERN